MLKETPTDEVSTDEKEIINFLSLADLCHALSISYATGLNWVKLGKLKPDLFIQGAPVFSRDYFKNFKENMTNNNLLKSRRNKSLQGGLGLYDTYLPKNSPNRLSIEQLVNAMEQVDAPSENLLLLLLLDVVLQLFACQKRVEKDFTELNFPKCNFVGHYVANSAFADIFSDIAPLFEPFFLQLSTPKEEILAFLKQYPQLFQQSYTYADGEDLPGMVYLSIKALNQRKALGAYYTPTPVVKKLLGTLFKRHAFFASTEFLDPCCGTGNFLLQLPDSISLDQIYGNDIDPISILLTRCNMALKFKCRDFSLLETHFTVSDYFLWDTKKQFDVILGNPPWGSSFSKEENLELKKRYQCIQKKPESYVIATEQSLKLLKEQGVLSFVIPESVLSVSSHRKIRKKLLEECCPEAFTFLGNVFPKVHCPCIVLQVKKTKTENTTVGLQITELHRSYTINTNRPLHWSRISLKTNDEEYALLQKLYNHPNHTTLKGNATFALGIVTGNNALYLKKRNSKKREPIVTGTNISKYHLAKPTAYIEFSPEKFQQAAPEQIYRREEKLLYRFINKELTFAYDDGGLLTLNSCNVLIPEFKTLDIKYILAVLNSKISQFIFEKEFQSVKVLRSHLEQLPIPVISKKEQEKIISVVDAILNEKNKKKCLILYEKIEMLLTEHFHLTQQEYTFLKNALKK